MTTLTRTMLFLLFTTLSFFQLSCKKEGLTQKEADTLIQSISSEINGAYVHSIEPHWQSKTLIHGEFKMPFWYTIHGDKPEKGYPLYISMHGGGSAPKEINDQQWENQKRLYGNVPGIYWVPRAPVDAWNMWHQDYMDAFLLQAITYAVEKLDADPERIYLMGYSAGGDGTFNLAPRLADRFAAAAMMAGHPGDARAENLRNLPFALYMGGQDKAFNRNILAADWKEKLDTLEKSDLGHFIHKAVIYPDKGHWMDNEDKESIPWLAQFQRDAYPDKIIWIQDDVLAHRKYNLEVTNPKQGDTLIISFDKATNTAHIEQSDYTTLTLWFNDSILDLEKDITIFYQGKAIYKGTLPRTEENIRESLTGRYDRAYAFPAKTTVTLSQNKTQP